MTRQSFKTHPHRNVVPIPDPEKLLDPVYLECHALIDQIPRDQAELLLYWIKALAKDESRAVLHWIERPARDSKEAICCRSNTPAWPTGNQPA